MCTLIQNSNHSHIKQNDHFKEHDGVIYAGDHLLIDVYEATELNNIALMESVFKKIVEVCGATLLHIHLHHFSPTGGISGVAVLAESHISVHTWPEHDYAAFDVFMCGNSEPELAIPAIEKAFKPNHIVVNRNLRGEVI